MILEEKVANSTRMKVLMIEHFSSSNMYTVDLCNELYKYVDLKLVTVNDSSINKALPYEYQKYLYGRYEGSSLKKVTKYLSSLKNLVKDICINKYSVVHIQTFRNMKVEILLFFLLKPFVKGIVYTAHNILPHESNRVDYLLHKLMYNLSNRIVVHNNESKKILMSKFNIKENRISTIPHGIYSYETKTNGAAPKSTILNILLFGMIRKYKGVDLLIEAVNKIPEEYKKFFHVTIAGKQNENLDNTNYKDLIDKYGLNDIITFMPRRIDDEELNDLYNNTDVCVFPYRNIYGSGSLLMSYTFNKPVIASNLPAFIEETDNGRAGLLFKNEDSDDFARKLMEFYKLEEEQLNDIKSNINNLVSTKYNWKVSAKMTYDVYENEVDDYVEG